MRVNEAIALVGPDILLVPYRKEHVEKYHDWMQDPEIQAATASEPLSIEEEYEMQKSWHTDEDKLTFIILERNKDASTVIPNDLTQGMIGDVNLFLTDAHDIEGEDQLITERTDTARDVRKQGELEIMIAEASARRKGYARQALRLMICFAMKHLQLGPEDLIVRIGMNNTKSIQMFGKMGFEIVKQVDIFQEVELRVRQRVEQFKWLIDSDKPTNAEVSLAYNLDSPAIPVTAIEKVTAKQD